MNSLPGMRPLNQFFFAFFKIMLLTSARLSLFMSSKAVSLLFELVFAK